MDDDRLRDRITELAECFPGLRGAPGVEPWEPHELNRWAVGPASSGQRHAARFLLAVWDNSAGWECGPFDIVEAMAAWDEMHRAAFLGWAVNPWWP